MKRMIILLTFLAFLACSEDENTVKQEPSIYGTWQLSEIYSDPGTGEGLWVDIILGILLLFLLNLWGFTILGILLTIQLFLPQILVC